MVRLADLRMKQGLSQRQLAKNLSSNTEKVRFSPSTIALYELGMRTPGLKRAKIIARYFGLPLEDIVFGPHACNSQPKGETVNQ